MAQSKFTLYKYIKLLFRRKNQANPRMVGGKEEEHPEGAYYLYHKKNWILVASDALEAQRQRNVQLDAEEFKRLRGMAPLTSPKIASITPKRTLADAVEEWTSRYSCTWTPKIESFSG